MKLTKKLLMASCLVLGAACASKKKPTADNAVHDAKSGIRMEANWVKDKGSKYDIELVITNQSEKARILMLAEIQCHKGATRGTLKHTFFNTGERVIDFRPNERKVFRLVCELGGKADGNFKITVDRIFDNESGDGETRGKVVGKNLVWEMK